MTCRLGAGGRSRAVHRLGVNFTGRTTARVVDIESLVLNTAAVAGAGERLTICAVSWLVAYHALIDGRRLSELTRKAPPQTHAYLGAMLSLAVEAPEGAGHAPEFVTALSHCRTMRQPRAFYDIFERMPAFRHRVKTTSLPLYRRWGLWHDDMTLKSVSLHALDGLLKVPELRARALSRQLGISNAATHAAVERLVGRGLLLRQRNGVKQDLRLSPLMVAAFEC